MFPIRLLGGMALLLGLLALAGAPASAQESEDARPSEGAPSSTIDVVEAVGVLDDPLTNFVIGAIERAEDEGSEALVIRLDTPGALGGDIDRLVETIEQSQVPVVVYVGTAGAHAHGAGVRVATAAHVLAIAPTSVLGVAHPEDLGDPNAVTTTALAEDLAQLAGRHDRSEDFLVEAAEGGAVVAVPDGEAGEPLAEGTSLPEEADRDLVRTLDQEALVDEHIADIVAPSLQEVLAALGGREVATAGGDTITLDVDPVTANVRFVNLGLAQRILHTASSPTLAYLLLLAGFMTLLFELFQPGFGVAGFSAIGILLLGAYSLFPLPVTIGWALLALVGILLLAYDLATAALSWPTILGTVALGAGSLLMWPVAALAPPAWLVVVGTLSAAIFVVFVMTSVLRAQGNQALLGASAVEGKVGIVRSNLSPEGHVFVGGSLWRARAPEGFGKVRTGTKVRVLGLNDSLTLDVEIVEDEPEERAPEAAKS